MDLAPLASSAPLADPPVAGEPGKPVERVGRSGPRTTSGFLLRGLVTLLLSAWGIWTWPAGMVSLAGLALVLVPLERLFPRDPVRLARKGLGTDLAYFWAAGAMVAFAVSGVVIVLGRPLRALLDPVATPLAGLPPAPRLALGLAVTLVAGYWAHRLAHQVPALWRLHAVHHAMTELDWLTGVRAHPLDTAFVSAFYAVPLFALGLESEAHVGMVGQLLFFAAYLQHANIGVRLPVLRWVVPNPEWHAWHHTADQTMWDKNFSVLPVVDVLFGTHYLPKDDRSPSPYGCPEDVPTRGFLAQLRWPFSEGLRPFRAEPGSRAG